MCSPIKITQILHICPSEHLIENLARFPKVCYANLLLIPILKKQEPEKNLVIEKVYHKRKHTEKRKQEL